jgi:hypothetical protein
LSVASLAQDPPPPAPASGVTAAPPAGSKPPLPPPIRYRLVASAFIVNHQTLDDVTERDGRGDEIFIRADWYDYRNFGRYMARATAWSQVFGERSTYRAGSGKPGPGSADGQPGGLVTNDVYPPHQDVFEAKPSPRRGDLPVVLWEGTLRLGDAVLIVPSIWEWDSPKTSVSESAWQRGLDRQARSLHLGQSGAAGEGAHGPSFVDGAIHTRDLIQPLMIFDDGNRPIGALIHGSASRAAPAGMPIDALVLTYDSARRAAEGARMFGASITNADGTVTSAEYPGPSGGFTISFADPPQLEGIYTLYLRLVRAN